MTFYKEKKSSEDRSMDEKQLSALLEMNSSEAVLNEVKTILHLIYPDFDDSPIISAFNLTIKLFKGNYLGYRACNSEYHDIHHTIDTFLAMARLIHGAVIEDTAFTERQIVQSLISALLHDAGYIQEEHDKEGTGSKYTAEHVQRSMDFVSKHSEELGLLDKEVEACRDMILCTDLAVDISSIDFLSPKIEILSKMLGTADLLAQMADRTYLEKLLFLYHEFKEAKVGGYEGEVDLLRKTVGFYDFISQRLRKTLDATDQFMASHFASRWDIQTNLYHEAIEKQRNYLNQILENPDSDPRDSLKRGEIVPKVREKYGDNG